MKHPDLSIATNPLTIRQVITNTRQALNSSTKLKRTNLGLLLISSVFLSFFAVSSSMLNFQLFSYFFSLNLFFFLFGYSIFILIIDKPETLNLWKDQENKAIIVKGKFFYSLKNSLYPALSMILLYIAYYFWIRPSNTLSSIHLPLLESVLIYLHFFLGIIAAYCYFLWFVAYFVEFEEYDFENKVLKVNANKVLPGFLSWIVLFILFFAVFANYYVAIIRGEVLSPLSLKYRWLVLSPGLIAIIVFPLIFYKKSQKQLSIR